MSSATDGSLHVALLRGINVGGKNKLPMAALVASLEEAGARDVRTYIQSGNAVFLAKSALVVRLPGIIAAAIGERYGFQVPIAIRSAGEFRKVTRDNPFSRDGADAKALHVAFLSEKPKPDQVAGLDTDRSPPDQFMVHGQEIYLLCPNGLGRSKLTNRYFESKLRSTSTVRSWKTVLALTQMLDG